MRRPDNGFLASLKDETFDALAARLSAVAMRHGEVLYQPDDPVRFIYFPVEGVVSVLTTMSDGRSIETAMTGNEGAVGVLEGLGGGYSATRMAVQVEGHGFKMPASAFRSLAFSNADLMDRSLRLIELQMAESRQSGMCQALHPVEPRLARWLAETVERSGGRTVLPLTQEFLSAMLGVQRTTVSAFASDLQRAGLIRYSRGRIEIRDLQGVEHRACECRSVLKAARAGQGVEPRPAVSVLQLKA